jgi:hypothetical protein
MKHLILIIFIFFLAAPFKTSALINELEATPSSMLEQGAILLLTEVNFKNTNNDFIVFTYKAPSENPINLKGLYLVDDYSIKKIEQDFWIASGQQVLLTFNSSEIDKPPYLYTTKSGLTGTTEQVFIYDNNKTLLDMVCWTSSSPTASEIKDFLKAYEEDQWHSNDITSCINSENVNKNISIKRKNLQDTNSAEDWIIDDQKATTANQPATSATQTTATNPPTQVSIIELSKQEIENIPPEIEIDMHIPTPDLIEIDLPEIIETKSASTSTKNNTKTTTKKTTTKTVTYKNGTLSDKIYISEIMANPDGTDTNKEWIELHNADTKKIHLGNWTLDDIEGGSKPYTLPDSLFIEPGKAILIDSKTSKISLGNKEDSVRLFDFNGLLIDEVDYEEAPSGHSYSRIIIQNEDNEEETQYLWTKDITPGQENPIYFEFLATVIAEPVFELDYYFLVKGQNEQVKKILFSEETIAAPLAKITFTKNMNTQLITQKKDEDTYILKNYETLGSPAISQEKNNFLFPALLTIALICAAAIYTSYKKIPWQNQQTRSQDKNIII